MQGLESSLYPAAAAVCAFSAGLLGRREQQASRSLSFFTVFLALEALGFLFEWAMAHPATPFKALWLGLRLGTVLLLAPTLWLAVKESVEGIRPRFATIGRGHLALMAAGFVCTWPLLASAHGGVDYFNPVAPTSLTRARWIHAGMLLCIGVFAGQAPWFLLRCRQLLLAHVALPGNATQTRGDAAAGTWLHLPLLIVGTTWLLGIGRTLQCATHAPGPWVLLSAFLEVGITVGAVYTMVRRATTSPARLPAESAAAAAVAITREPDPEPALTTTPPSSAACPSAAPASLPVETIVPDAAPKYAKARLAAAARARIQRKLLTALADPAFSSDPLLSLRSLCSTLKENSHAVSQVINQDLNSSFYALVNAHRIAHAQHLLRTAPDQTVLEIALAVGFNAKSTFHTAFRRLTGVTPTAFRATSHPPDPGSGPRGKMPAPS